jgi:hypothetical protein
MSGPTPDPGRRRGPPQRGVMLVAVLIAIALILLAVHAWLSIGDVAMSASGYVALVLGILGTVGLGAGLMALVFYSHRHGYDEKAGGGEPPRRDER